MNFICHVPGKSGKKLKMKNKLYILLNELKEISNIKDIGLHKIYNNTLIPIAKNRDGLLNESDWMTQHSNCHVNINDDFLIKKAIEEKKEQFIIDCCNNSTEALNSFFIKSVYIFPIIINNDVVGIFVLASINNKITLSNEIINTIKKTIKENTNDFIGLFN